MFFPAIQQATTAAASSTAAGSSTATVSPLAGAPSCAVRTWGSVIREALEKRSGWLHGTAPSWLPWRPRVIVWAAQSLAAAVEAGGLRDAETFAQAATAIWTAEVGRMRFFQVCDWLRLVAKRLVDDGVMSACTAIVRHGSVSDGRVFNVKKWSVATKMAHLERFYCDFPSMTKRLMTAKMYEAQHGLSEGSLSKWRARCLLEKWFLWDERGRRENTTAPQRLRLLYGLPKLGRRFEDYYPNSVMSKAATYVQSQVKASPGHAKRVVKVADVQVTLAGLVQDANRRVERIHVARATEHTPPAPFYRGTGSVRAARVLRERLGLVNKATAHSKQELTLDSPEMVEFIARVQAELRESVPELLCNMDEMWRRQMRDDRLRSLHEKPLHHVDTAAAAPSIDIEYEQPRRQCPGGGKARVSLLAEYGAWVGPWHPTAAACEGERSAAQRLVAAGGTYKNFDEWQCQVQGRKNVRRRRGRRPPPQAVGQKARGDVPPGGRHRKGKTIITFVFASGHRGPTVTMYSKSALSVKAAAQTNDRFAPEHIFHNTGRRSHMMDGTLFLWYVCCGS